MKRLTVKEFLEEKGIDTSRVIDSNACDMYAVKTLESNVAIIKKYRRDSND